MAFTDAQKRELDKFCLETGGGIFGDKDKKNPAPKPIVVIGLGGLGTKTLNELKHKVMLRIRDYDKYIKFLAIDSDDRDMASIKASSDGKGGYMNETEMTNLYSPDVANVIRAGTYKNEKWITPDWKPTVNGGGCGQQRQNGRFLLSVSDVFNRIDSQITSKINAARVNAPNDKVNVIFIAGISGGTGSGTFIDIAYITHNAFHKLGIRNYKIAAYIYTPDVQYSNPNINHVGQTGLSKNGFAALKELDYYMNLEKIGGEYKWPFSAAGENFKRNIYDSCVIVTGKDSDGAVIGSEEKCRDALTETILLALSDTTFMNGGVPEQMIESLMDNNIASFNNWSLDGEGADDNVYPKTCNYVYNSVGYGSVKIPVDYIMTYIANEMYKYAMNELEITPDQNYINGIMSQADVVDYESIDRNFREKYLGKIIIPRNKKPNIKDLANGTNKYNEYKNLILNGLYDQLESDVNDDVKNFVSNAKKTIVNRLENSFSSDGPIFVNKALSKKASVDSAVSGIIERLAVVIHDCCTYHDELIDKFKRESDLDAAIMNYASGLNTGILGLGGDNIDDVLPVVDLTIAKFALSIKLAEKMNNAITSLREELITYCNNIFEVYTKVIDYIGSLLEKDANMAIRGEYSDNSYTAYAINTKKDNNNKFSVILYKYLDDVVLTNEYKQKFYNDFKGIITGEGKDSEDKKDLRNKFTSDDMNTFAAVQIMRDEFNNLLDTYSQDAIERFLVVYYGGLNSDSVEQDFNDIWNDPDKKAEALNKAAETIKEELQNKGKCLYQAAGGAMNPIVGKYFVTCPSTATSLLTALKTQFAQESNVIVCTVDGAKSVDKIQNVYGLALAKIAGIPDAMKVYDKSVKEGKKDFHLDGSDKSDFTELPSPVPVEMFDKLHLDSEHERNVVAKVNKDIDDAINLGIITKPTAANSPWNYTYIDGADDFNVTTEMINDMCNAPIQGDNIEDVKLVADKYITSKGKTIVGGNITMDPSGFKYISDEQTMRHIVRKNMDVYRRIRDSVKVYRELINPVVEMHKKRKEASDNLIKFKDDVKKFSDYINYGLIRLNEVNMKDWMYDAGDGINAGKLVSGYNDSQFYLDNIIFIAFMEFFKIPKNAARALELSVKNIREGVVDEDPDIELLMSMTSKLARIAEKPVRGEDGKINLKAISSYNVTRRAVNEEDVLTRCEMLNRTTGYFDVNILGISNPYDLLVLFYNEFREARSIED